MKFDPKATADDLFTRAKAELPDKASEVGDVVPAMQADTKAAAEKYKAVSPAEGAYVFPVKATGTVTEATDANLRLKVAGVPEETPLIVPLTTAINGTAIRDVMGFKFADAPGQTDYQYVGDELKKLMQADVKSAVSDPAALKGKKVTVVGRVSVIGAGTSVPKPKPVNIQPLSIEASVVTSDAGSVATAPRGAAATDDDVVLKAVDISKTYGVTRALKGVNFEVRRGKVTVLFGENGAGKSTLMKILSGVEKPTAGQLILDGEPVDLQSTTDAVERGISIIHQELNLCANLSVRDNIFIGRELRTATGTVDYAQEREITEPADGATRGADPPRARWSRTFGSASSRSSRSPGLWPPTRAS